MSITAAGEGPSSWAVKVRPSIGLTRRVDANDAVARVAASCRDSPWSSQLTESCTISQDGRAATIGPGDFALYDSERPYTLHMERPFRQLVWQLPRTMLLDRAPALREHIAS